jgi:hypothetical protein
MKTRMKTRMPEIKLTVVPEIDIINPWKISFKPNLVPFLLLLTFFIAAPSLPTHTTASQAMLPLFKISSLGLHDERK